MHTEILRPLQQKWPDNPQIFVFYDLKNPQKAKLNKSQGIIQMWQDFLSDLPRQIPICKKNTALNY